MTARQIDPEQGIDIFLALLQRERKAEPEMQSRGIARIICHHLNEALIYLVICRHGNSTNAVRYIERQILKMVEEAEGKKGGRT